MLLAETRRNEEKGQLCSSKSFFREPPVLEDSLLHSLPLQSFKSSSVSCMAAIHTFWLPRNTDCCLARDVHSSVGRFVSYNSAVPEKNSQKSEDSVFLKMNKAGKYLLERLRAPDSLIHAELQSCLQRTWAALPTTLVLEEILSYYPDILICCGMLLT